MSNWKRPLTTAEVVVKLFDVGGLKFGNFTMRNGELTPVYIDMRVLWSYPDLVVLIAIYFFNRVGLQFNSNKI